MTLPTLPTLTLGRDGMGPDADEAAFQNWAAFVAAGVDAACGFPVYVALRGKSGVQNDSIAGADDTQRATILDAKRELWDAWCAAGAPAPGDAPAGCLVEFDMESPNGPRVRIYGEIAIDEVEAQTPHGWSVSWDGPPAGLRSTRDGLPGVAYPLVPTAAGAESR